MRDSRIIQEKFTDTKHYIVLDVTQDITPVLDYENRVYTLVRVDWGKVIMCKEVSK